MQDDKQPLQPTPAQPEPVTSPQVQPIASQQPAQPNTSVPANPQPVPPRQPVQSATTPPANQPQPPNMPQPVSQPEQAAPQKKSKVKLIIFIVLGIVAVFIIGIVLFIVFIFSAVNNATAAPLSASDSFIKSITTNNASLAYASTSAAFQKVENQAKFNDFIKQYNSEVNPNYTVVINKNISSNNGVQTATINYNIQAKGTAKNLYMRVELIQENGQWKVQNIEYKETPYGDQ